MRESALNLFAGVALIAASTTCYFNLRSKPRCDEDAPPPAANATCLNENETAGLVLGMVEGWGCSLPCFAVGIDAALAARRRRRNGLTAS